MDGNKTFRVYNKTSYDIGVTLTSGLQPVIRKGSFLPLSVNDILYLESIARERRPFSAKELVPVDDSGKELTLEEIGGWTDTYTEKHFDKNEIGSMLKKTAKQIEKWLEDINDPVELHSIAEVAAEMDLPLSKTRLIKAKIPNTDLLGE